MFSSSLKDDFGLGQCITSVVLKDNLWIAMCHGGAVIQVDTQAGSIVRKLSFPCVETTACTFGGDRYDRLFVTTGLHKTLCEPDAGKVFVVDGLMTNGFPVVPYKGNI